jgi:hypothetical protein
MQETGSKIELKLFIQDDSFRAELAAGYNLFIFLDDYHLSCAVATHGENEFAGLENWSLGARINEVDNEDLNESFRSSAFLQHDGYRNIVCCIAAGNPLFIPNALFDESMASEHLKFATGEKSGSSEFIDHLRRIDASAVFSAPAQLVKYLKGKFPNIVFHHAATAMVEYLLSAGKNNKEHHIAVHFSGNRAGIFVTNGKNLELCNYYNFESPEEMVYYLVFICEQLHLNPDSVAITFTGEMHADSPVFALASRYIRNVSIGTRPTVSKFTAAFNELPPGEHFNLFTQSVCVS